ncbi:hypothetical protein [Propionispora hippei]|uniref:Uncharacterized protein n=1 Tax=Propionispora hippei DSM 15287 TaxID=1123003 RepID=A0A1M6MHB0_9FIRM|nr:hypothetical protein [Propionispora hippei]SHJ82683.1 hypothetical protein SAMN02745170_03434 [Propionispora hippei DSM 15287]
MASNVASALGTQRQFSAMPQNTYEQRLTSLPAHVGVTAPASNDGVLLARSLGVLGDSLMALGVAKEKDREKVDTAATERLLKGVSEEDLKKLKAIDLLNTYGHFELADSPYAINLIEKWRGKYFGSKTLAEYSELVAQEGRAKTSEEEAARFSKFYNEKLPEYLKETSHEQAFREGFFDNFHVDLLSQVKAQIADYSKDLRAVRDGTIQADFGQLAQNSLNLTSEELTAKAQELFRGAAVTKMTREERMALAKTFLNNVAVFSASPDKVKALSSIELFTGDDGNPVLLGSKVDNSEAIQNAIISARRMNDEYVFKKRIEMQKLKPDEILPWMQELKKNDPEMYHILAPESEQVYHNAVVLQKQEEARKAKALAKQAAMNQKRYIWRAQFNAHMNNQATDGRYPVAQSLSGLPDAYFVDENGNTVKSPWTPEEAYDLFKENMMELYMKDISPQEKAKTAMQVLRFGPGESYVKALKGQIQGALDTASTHTIVQDMDVGSVRSALEMYEADSGTFGRIFGPEITASIQTIRSLRDLGKSTDDALTIFVQGREALKDPTLKEQYETNYKNRKPSSVDITDMSGSTASVPITEDSILNSHIHTMALYLQGAGYPIETAMEIASGKAKENYWAYNNHVFPKAWFSGLNVDDKAATASAFMDNQRQALASYSGVDASHIFAIYNPYTDRIEIKGNGVSATYDRELFTNQANQFAYDSVQRAKNTPIFQGDYKIEAPKGETHEPTWWDKTKEFFHVPW